MNKDGTGPKEEGPRTGRGLGDCPKRLWKFKIECMKSPKCWLCWCSGVFITLVVVWLVSLI